MAKTIKFNLILDGNLVRTIEDLRNNFSIEDIIELYRNGILQRWLDVRGYSELLKKVIDINVDSNIEIAENLIKIFGVEIDNEKIKKGITILDYLKKKRMQLDKYSKLNFELNTIINNYHSEYANIIFDIIKNRDDMFKIKTDIKKIEKNYIQLFNLNYRDVYDNLIINAPLAVFAILMNDEMKKYFINNKYSNKDTNSIYAEIKTLIEDKDLLRKELGDQLKSFKGDTDQYWKDIEPKGKKFMIIYMVFGDYVRNVGVFGEELSCDNVNGKFLILDGIDYKSNNMYNELLYMEV